MELTTQQKKALDLQRNIIVSAGAGSGKTTILVERYLNILLTQPDTSVHNILAITFTDKAAQEMKQRILEKLFQLFESQPAWRPRIFEILKHQTDMHISTIHSFCHWILQEHVLLSDFPPDILIASDPEIGQLFNRVFWQFFHGYQPPEAVTRQLHLAALREFEVRKLKELFYQAYSKRAILLPSIRALANSSPHELVSKWDNLRKNFFQELFQNFWKNSHIQNCLTILFQAFSTLTGKTAQELIRTIENLLEAISSASSEVDLKIDATQELIDRLLTKQGTSRKQIESLARKAGEEVKLALNDLVAECKGLFETMLPEAEDRLSNYHLAEVQCGLSRMLMKFFDLLNREKRRLQIVDFDDLLIETWKMLSTHPEVATDLRNRFRWILVDEFQDTDRLQSQIIHLLTFSNENTTSNNNLFLVGDPKQSIYGFRQADVTIFQEFLQTIQTQPTERLPFTIPGSTNPVQSTPEERHGTIELPDNFRSSRLLIHFFNRCFVNIFTRQSEYDVDFSELKPARIESREIPSRIELHLTHCQEPLVQAEYIPHEMATMVQIIHSLVNQPAALMLDHAHNRPVLSPIQYKDIAILLRDRSKLLQVEHALQSADIPYEVYKGMGFYQTNEVQDIYYLLKAITDPQDNFAMIAALRSPFIGVSDVGLFYLSRCLGENYFQRIQSLVRFIQGMEKDSFLPDFEKFLESSNIEPRVSEADRMALELVAKYFPRWHELAHQGKYTILLNDIMEELHIPAVLQAEFQGERKQANLEKLVQFAYEFEQRTSGRITDFMDTLRDLIQGSVKEGEATLHVESGDQVRILTIHAAKGLEFPVVILPFLESDFQFKESIYFNKHSGVLFPLPSSQNKSKPFIENYFKRFHKQRVLAEEKRLLYVAATRARDHLFLLGATGIKRGNQQNRLHMLLRALEIDPASEPEKQSSLRVFKKTVNKTTALPEFGFVKKSGETPRKSDEILQRLPQILKYARPYLIDLSRGEYSATQLMIFQEDPNRYFKHVYYKHGILFSPVVEEDYEDEPGGLLWGTLVHKALENFHLRKPKEDEVYIFRLLDQFQIPIAKQSQFQKRLSPLLSKFRSTSIGQHLCRCENRSEVRAFVQFSSGTLVGVLDRLFKNENGFWEVLDFKTNRITPRQLNELVRKYTPQMQYYALLLQQIFPHQRHYPVRLFFLSVMQSYQMIFEPSDLVTIRERTEKVIRALQGVEQQFYRDSLQKL